MIYLDTSVAVGIFVPELKSANILRWFGTCTDTIVSADWIVTEFASALSIKVRRGSITAEDAEAAWTEFELFRRTGLRLAPVSRYTFAAAASLARDATSGLRSGDSLHLAMALEIGASAIATEDDTLDANARKHGLTVIRF
jgi:predicted nucleic acid-binding protein